MTIYLSDEFQINLYSLHSTLKLNYQRVLGSLGMMSVLLLTFTVSTDFVSRAYAAADFPTSDSGTKIRESINNQIIALGPLIASVQIVFCCFPGQTGDSVTVVGTMCSRETGDCSGSSNILIPGIGEGTADFFARPAQNYFIKLTFSGFPHQMGTSTITGFSSKGTHVYWFAQDLSGIGTGLLRLITHMV